MKNAMTIEKMDMKELANSSGNDTAASLWHDRCAQASASAMPACAPGACNDRAAGRTGARRSSSCGNRSRTARQARARRRYRRQPRTASASSASAARRQSRTSRAPGCGCSQGKAHTKQREQDERRDGRLHCAPEDQRGHQRRRVGDVSCGAFRSGGRFKAGSAQLPACDAHAPSASAMAPHSTTSVWPSAKLKSPLASGRYGLFTWRGAGCVSSRSSVGAETAVQQRHTHAPCRYPRRTAG